MQLPSLLEAPVDIHGMGDHEPLPATAGSASTIARTYMQGGGWGGGGGHSCFDIFAGLWVYLYERAVPHAQREVQQNFLLDELQACTVRLRVRRDGIHERMVQGAHEARRARSRGDTKALRARMVGVRRLRGQVDRIDTSLAAIENNIDEIVHSDVTKDIIDSLRRSTEAMRNQGAPLGGMDRVQETMDDLQAELQASQDITDAIHRSTADAFGVVSIGSGMSEEELMSELDAMLLGDEGGEKRGGEGGRGMLSATAPQDAVLDRAPSSSASFVSSSVRAGTPQQEPPALRSRAARDAPQDMQPQLALY